MQSSDLAPRSKEPRRRDLERKFLAETVKAKGIRVPKPLQRRLQKIFTKKNDDSTTEVARRDNDMKRRQGVLELIQLRVRAGAEAPSEEIRWKALANVDEEKWKEKEGEHRAFIIAELASRAEKKFPDWETPEDLNARKAERRLMFDTLRLQDHGGIPAESLRWVRRSFRKAKPLNRKEDRRADAAARKHALSYIAACRREAGVDERFEKTGVHNNYRFSEINLNVTKQELELDGWGWLPGDEEDEVDSNEEESAEDRGMLVRTRSQAPSPDSCDHWSDDNAKMDIKEEMDEDEAGVPVPVGDNVWTEDNDEEVMHPEPILAGEGQDEDCDDGMKPEPVSTHQG